MLQELHIQDLAVIADTTIAFDKDFVVLVGETGAGKSLIVDSLNLLSGAKSDKGLIRDGAERLVVSALFHLRKKEGASYSDFLDDDGNLLLRRTLSRSGTSRYVANGIPLSQREARQLTASLIDIHSQGQNSDLLDEGKALSYLDAFGKETIAERKESFQEAYEAYQKEKKEYEAFLSADKELDGDYLDFQIQEIEKYDLQPDEIEDLERQLGDLQGLEKVQEAIERFRTVLQIEEGSCMDILDNAVGVLRGLSGTSLEEEAAKAVESYLAFKESLSSLRERYEELDADPGKIDRINERLFALKGLMRKYGKSTKAILDRLEEFRKKRELLDSFEEEKGRREANLDALLTDCQEKAGELSQERRKWVPMLEKAVGSQMADLGLPEDGFLVNLEGKDLAADGKDRCAFFVRLNKGLAPASLKKAASGGESSRLMLSIKAVLNRLNPVELLILDEIDTGVSGRMAALMARKIKAMSKDSQVIVISHLAQVVAAADGAILVQKKTMDSKTMAMAKPLDRKGQIEEVAKMISSGKLGESALRQAEALMTESEE